MTTKPGSPGHSHAPKPVKFTPGSVIVREGDASTCLYIIKKGTVAVRKAKGSNHVEIARLYTNEVFGELSFFDKAPRSATMIALTEVETIEIGFDVLDAVYKQLPEYLRTISAALAERLRKANETIKRLQKDVVTESGQVQTQKESAPMSATEVLAALEGGTSVDEE